MRESCFSAPRKAMWMLPLTRFSSHANEWHLLRFILRHREKLLVKNLIISRLERRHIIDPEDPRSGGGRRNGNFNNLSSNFPTGTSQAEFFKQHFGSFVYQGHHLEPPQWLSLDAMEKPRPSPSPIIQARIPPQLGSTGHVPRDASFDVTSCHVVLD